MRPRRGGAVRSPHERYAVGPAVIAGVAPAELAAALRRLCAAAGREVPPSPPLAPVLALDLGGPAAAEIAYEAARRRLFVPCPIAPPVGDDFVLEVTLPAPTRRRVPAFVRVEEVRGCEEAAPGHPAGFLLVLHPELAAAHAALAAAVPGGGDGSLAALDWDRADAPTPVSVSAA